MNLLSLRFWLLYLSVFTLPMYMRLNNVILGLFLFFSLVHGIFILKSFDIKKVLQRGWPVIAFFLLAVMATLHELTSRS